MYQGKQSDSDSSKKAFGLDDIVIDEMTNSLGNKNHIRDTSGTIFSFRYH